MAASTLRWFGSILVALSIVLVACAPAPRRALTAPIATLPEIPGMPAVRFWGDEITPPLERWLRESLDRERAFYAAQGVAELPDVSYLALSGGGADGAYGAGVLCGWSARGDRPAFRIVTGISTGALIAPFAFVGPDYDHVLREVYTTLSTDDLVRQRGLLEGLIGESIFDASRLRSVVARHVDERFLARVAEEYRKGRGLVIGTTDLDAQRPVIWAMGAIAASGHPNALNLFRDVMVASASIPGVFPPVMISVEVGGQRYDEMHADGGTASQVFLYPASFSLKQFSEQVGIQRQRTVYIIRNGRLTPDYDTVPRRTFPIAQRALSTLIKTQGAGDLYRIYLGCLRDEINYRLAYIPPDFTAQPQEMFDPAYMGELFELGYRRAQAGYPWSTAPPGFEPPALDTAGQAAQP